MSDLEAARFEFLSWMITSVLPPDQHAWHPGRRGGSGSAASGEDALGILRSKPTDLVLLDLRMPGMNGIDTLAMRSSGRKSMCASSSSPALRRTRNLPAVQAGAQGYLRRTRHNGHAGGDSPFMRPALFSASHCRTACAERIVRTIYPARTRGVANAGPRADNKQIAAPSTSAATRLETM